MTATQSLSPDQQYTLALAERLIRAKTDRASSDAGALLEPLLKADIARAHTLQGFIYLRGIYGAAQDIELAANRWRHAYNLGDDVAATRLGRLHMGGCLDCGPYLDLNVDQAIQYLQTGVDRGNAEAAFRLGLIYDPRLAESFGHHAKAGRATSYYKHAAIGGYISAQCVMMSDCYEAGSLAEAAFYANMVSRNPSFRNLDCETQGLHERTAQDIEAAITARYGRASPLLKAWHDGTLGEYFDKRLGQAMASWALVLQPIGN